MTKVFNKRTKKVEELALPAKGSLTPKERQKVLEELGVPNRTSKKRYEALKLIEKAAVLAEKEGFPMKKQ